jgi:hypothetical protein
MSYFQRLRSVWYPDEFHGWGLQRRYFEGWYYKLVSADEQHALAVIPGISMAANGEKHAFIQVMDGKACRASYHRFEAQDFQSARDRFDISVGKNSFSADRINLSMPDISGQVRFIDTQRWPKMLGAPGIMGWYSFVPFMECNHGVVSLHHQLEGSLSLQDPALGTLREVDFTGGKGYMEKDWGRSFPRAYVWMQSNHFGGHDRASLMASAAHIPWLKGHFIGFISGFWLDGRLFKFATYNGSRKFLKITEERVELIFQRSGLELRILASQAPGTALKSPMSGEMTGKIQESLQAVLQVELLENGRRIFEGNGRNAGLEVAGEVEVLQP